MVHTVPMIYPGAFRRVYPGFLQLASFLGMNWSRHVDAHWDYFSDMVKGDGDSAAKHREFYDEYLSVLDLTEEFYLQTIRDVFQEHKLPRGLLMHRGRPVRPEAIRHVAQGSAQSLGPAPAAGTSAVSRYLCGEGGSDILFA
jgi:poly(3-hydroxybutyrate) depolymerase